MAHLALCLRLKTGKKKFSVVPDDAFDPVKERRPTQRVTRRRQSGAKAGKKAKQNDQPIYTFAKHSFIINKSPFFV